MCYLSASASMQRVQWSGVMVMAGISHTSEWEDASG